MPPRNTPGNELVESRQTDDPRFGQAWSMPQHRPTFTFSISSCVSNHVSTKAGQAQDGPTREDAIGFACL